ncbi:histidine utilization repressor [Halomonas garicola]|uniref:histidine utilization repressor n=1 Tax=Halomonas garicola TaxID=1690008 RepID=UPI002899DF74|nr:histidine utilization repressor [Halomonas garicola]
MGKTLPLYLQIQQHLLEKIQSGNWAAEHQIPPEEQLARDFGVSRMTANKAIHDLVQQGYLVRQAGVGTFVTDHKAESSLVEVHNIADEVRNRGHEYSCDVLIVEAKSADDEVSLRLGVRLSTRVFHTLILHYENGIPIQLEDRYVNPRHAPRYLETDFHQQTPNEVLVEACPITDVEHVVEAMLVDPETAALLDIDAQQPCLQLIRRTWSGEQLISYARLTHPGDRYKLRSSLHTS